MNRLEEKWNTITHAFGVVLFLFLGGLLLYKAGNQHPFYVGFIIYVLSLLLLFSASTLYHNAESLETKQKLRILDHISIYYLIAGTYTPVCLGILWLSKGKLLLLLVWFITSLGTVLKIYFTGRFEKLSLLLYGIMGWLIIIDLSYLLDNFSSNQLTYLGAGGFFYTVGIIFYAVKRIPYNHVIWHFFVLFGALAHFMLIFTLV